MKLLLLVLLLPAIAFSQEVKPILSTDYRTLIYSDSALARQLFSTDTFNSFKTANLTSSNYYNGQPLKKIRIRNNQLLLEPADRQTLYINCTLNSSFEYKTPNRQPALKTNMYRGAHKTVHWFGRERKPRNCSAMALRYKHWNTMAAIMPMM